MKKLGFVAVMLMVGASVAFASSISVPWYIDNAPNGTAMDPPPALTAALIYLKNNSSETTTCWISYNAQDGSWLGPDPNKGEQTTFVIAPEATMLFRPVAVNDSDLANGGQEGETTGALVPDRPRTVETKKNGSITIRFEGGPATIQGEITQQFKPASAGAQLVTYAYLLPPGN